ncbi:hypothetical protein V9T40_008370 [Parthenolecanium corni]|uniref:Biogenesis of lysosome-related organelles complex 1 subunit 7 n=1 Tax=Parthenolecanium corni TaxID=536013 RepID=A0AAN9TYA5_9HEMI
MEDEDSSSTSCDDKSVFNDNPTRDALADGLMSFLKPRVDNIYKLMNSVKENQSNLKTELDSAMTDLDSIFQGDDGLSTHFQKYADKICEMRHQMTVIENILQSAHNRLENFTGKIEVLRKTKKAQFDEFSASGDSTAKT